MTKESENNVGVGTVRDLVSAVGLGAPRDGDRGQDGEFDERARASGPSSSSTDDMALRPSVATGQDHEDEPRHEHREEDDGAEEGRTAIGIKAPTRVSRAEREEHERTHMPYRAWCPYRVKGRGKKMARVDKGGHAEEEKVPRISMDYFYMSKEDEKAHANPLIVVVDESTGDKYARAVGHKGVGKEHEQDWLIKDISLELKAWGHNGGDGGHIIMKSDGERSIVAVREAVAKLHGGRVTVDVPAKNESESNGAIEEAGKTVREFTRVLKEQLEDKAGMTLRPGDIIVLWMIRWAAMSASRFLMGKDGKTPYERRRGRRCQLPVLPFGEKVWYHEAREGKERKEKFTSECKEGIWLGHARNSNEAIIGTKDGVVRAYSIKRQDEDQRWSAEAIKQMRGSPQQPDPKKASIQIPVRVSFDPPSTERPDESKPLRNEKVMRRMMITAAMLEKYGYTEDCEGCRCKRSGVTGIRAEHTEVCRSRIEQAMDAEEDGQEKRRRDKLRIDRRMADTVETGQAENIENKEEDNMNTDIEGTTVDQDIVNENRENTEAEEGSADVEEENIDSKKRAGEQIVDEEAPEKKRPRAEDEDRMMDDSELIQALYKACEALRADISEVYSPPRITAEGEKWGLAPGEAMDLTNGWDFRRADHRQQAREHQRKRRPRLLVGSPMCTMFSALQNLSGWNEDKQRRWIEAKMHITFMMELYQVQVDHGDWFLHEHSAGATSWRLEDVVAIMKQKGTIVTVADQCMYGLTTWGKDGKMAPARKRTRFMTNCAEIAEELDKKCDLSHSHQHLMGGRAGPAARYPEGLCKAVCRGLIKAKDNQKKNVKKLFSIRAGQKIKEEKGREKSCEEHEHIDMEQYAVDDVTGLDLDAKEVMKARQKELQYIEDKKVWKRIPREQARKNGWKVIQTRWIDINKGDIDSPNYRSRFVGREFNDGVGEGLFAATPPFEGLRLILSEAATCSGRQNEKKVIMVNDVSRAFFEAPMRRNVCIELPSEEQGGKDEVGWLQMSLYGTRDAAANFQEEVKKMMRGAGFIVSRYNPAMFYHPGKGLRVLVHGDDFISVGKQKDVEWFRGALRGRFEVSTKIVGLEEGQIREARVLNRIVRVDKDGWYYEADQRHGEMIIKTLNMEGAKGVCTPGEDEKPWKDEPNGEELKGKDITGYRALAARANYLGVDRPDIQYAVKEICRGMSKPTRGDLGKLRRLARYLIEKPRAVIRYPWQGEVYEITGYTDSDWAGCRRTAKSTSGGVVLKGAHYIKSWSATQKNITLSSGEAEFVALVKMSTEIIGVQQLAGEWGYVLDGAVYVDSSAALGVTKRTGNGKLRHIRVGMLWVQQKEENGEISYRKVKGEDNPGDLMTKYLAKRVAEKLAGEINMKFEDGRAEASLRV